jgi:hypothetical protein
MRYVCGLCAGHKKVLDSIANEFRGEVVHFPEVGLKVACPKCDGTGMVSEDRLFLQPASPGNYHTRATRVVAVWANIDGRLVRMGAKRTA